MPRVDRRTWVGLLRETAIYAAATALGTVYFQVALISTSVLADDRETGTFGVAFRIIELANGIPWLLAASAFPVFARAATGEAARLRYATQRVAETALALGGLITLGTLVGAGVAVELVGGSGARDAEPVLRILAPAALASYLVAAWSFVLLSLQRYRDLFVTNLLALLAALALSLALVPPLGAEGAAFVTVALEVGLAAAYALVLHRRRPDLGPRADNVLAIVLALLAGLALALPLLGVSLVLATFAALAAYSGVLVALGGIPTELRAALPRRRRP
jgi:O-antigen/teichoic acid export membrane protein